MTDAHFLPDLMHFLARVGAQAQASYVCVCGGWRRAMNAKPTENKAVRQPSPRPDPRLSVVGTAPPPSTAAGAEVAGGGSCVV